VAEPSPARRPDPDEAAESRELPTVPLSIGGARHAPPDDRSTIRLFNSYSFFRLWLAQVVSSLGDWIGFVAIAAIAARLGGRSPEAAVGLVLSARLIPGFFLGTGAGVLVDRWDRKRVMVSCDIGRGVLLATLPFVTTVPGLFFASLLLEVLTLMWSPAKEASVPNLVQKEFLANANSLSLVAAYGTFPVASAMFAALAKVAERLSHYNTLHALKVSQESVAIYFDVVTFFLSAAMISTLVLPRKDRAESNGGMPTIDFRRSLNELAEGWRFIRSTPLVRSVILGLGCGLVGGGMVVPLGPVMSKEVLRAGAAGFGLLLTSLGFGVAISIVVLSVVQSRLDYHRAFLWALFCAGPFLVLGASVSTLTPALVAVFGLGVCSGAVYVLGFTILQTEVADELRGRTFATLYTMIRFCILLAFVLAPILSSLLGKVSQATVGQRLHLGDVIVHLPGARLTLWLAGVIIFAAGAVSRRSLRSLSRS